MQTWVVALPQVWLLPVPNRRQSSSRAIAVQESAAEGWLRCLGVLHCKAPSMHVRAGGKSTVPSGESDDEDQEAKEVDEWNTPCTLCGRAYPHVHQQTVRKGGVHSDSDEG